MAKKADKQKKGFIERVKKFFLGIYNELKLVVWPNKKTLKQAVGTVFLLCIIAGVLIFIVDTLMHGILNLVGFNDPTPRHHQTTTVETNADQAKVTVTEASETATATSAATTEVTSESAATTASETTTVATETAETTTTVEPTATTK